MTSRTLSRALAVSLLSVAALAWYDPAHAG
jgi:hypothetical protein